MSTKSQAMVRAQRETTGRGVDQFRISITDEKTRATVEVVLTPEQWALAMWGRGDVTAEAEWFGVELPKEQGK
jgi:hypothetical protein